MVYYKFIPLLIYLYIYIYISVPRWYSKILGVVPVYGSDVVIVTFDSMSVLLFNVVPVIPVVVASKKNFNGKRFIIY